MALRLRPKHRAWQRPSVAHAAGRALETAAGRLADRIQRMGEYRDTLVRKEEGWRIARREGRLVLHTGV